MFIVQLAINHTTEVIFFISLRDVNVQYAKPNFRHTTSQHPKRAPHTYGYCSIGCPEETKINLHQALHTPGRRQHVLEKTVPEQPFIPTATASYQNMGYVARKAPPSAPLTRAPGVSEGEGKTKTPFCLANKRSKPRPHF